MKRILLNKDIKELVTSDDIPDRLGPWEPVSNRAKKDKLYQKRLKKNPDLKKNIKKIGESMKTTITFTSSNQDAISRQWHLMFTYADKTWNKTDPSDIKINNGTYSFEIESYGKDQRFLDDDYIKSLLVAGVSFTKSVRESKEDQEAKVIESILEKELTPEQLADILLADEPTIEFDGNIGLGDFEGLNVNLKVQGEAKVKEIEEQNINIPKHIPKWFKDETKKLKQVAARMKSGSEISKVLKSAGYSSEADEINMGINKALRAITKLQKNIPILEAEVPDDEDAESDTIDDVQTMLTKMLPKTKGLKLAKDKEKELKSTLKKAMSMMGENEDEPEAGKKTEAILKNDIDKLVKVLGDLKNKFEKQVTTKMGSRSSNEKLALMNSYLQDADQLIRTARYLDRFDDEVKNESTNEAVDYPQFQYAIMLPRDDYQFAAKILNDSNIKAKTQFHYGDMAVIGFDHHQETGDGKPEVTEEEVLKILEDAGIAATSAAGIDFRGEPETLDISESFIMSTSTKDPFTDPTYKHRKPDTRLGQASHVLWIQNHFLNKLGSLHANRIDPESVVTNRKRFTNGGAFEDLSGKDDLQKFKSFINSFEKNIKKYEKAPLPDLKAKKNELLQGADKVLRMSKDLLDKFESEIN